MVDLMIAVFILQIVFSIICLIGAGVTFLINLLLRAVNDD